MRAISIESLSYIWCQYISLLYLVLTPHNVDCFILICIAATGIPNGDAAAQAALQQAYPTIPYPGIGNIGIGKI
jgi:hypothetical protein